MYPNGEFEEWLERFKQMAEVHEVYLAATTDAVKSVRKPGLLLSWYTNIIAMQYVLQCNAR